MDLLAYFIILAGLIVCRDVETEVMMFFNQGRIAEGFSSNIVGFIPGKSYWF